jgi:hypothetical protein
VAAAALVLAALVEAPVSAGGVVVVDGGVVVSDLGPQAANNAANAAINKTFFIFIPFISEVTLLFGKAGGNEA